MGLHLKKKLEENKTGVYVAGAVTAVGLAAFLYEKLKGRIEFSVKPASKPEPMGAADLETLKEKETHLTDGNVKHLAMKMDKAAEPVTDKIKPVPGASKPAPPKALPKPGIHPKALREAVLDYVTGDIQGKLEKMGLGKKKLVQIVGAVHDRTEEILALSDLEKMAGSSGTQEAQISLIIKTIKPQLMEEMKKIKQ